MVIGFLRLPRRQRQCRVVLCHYWVDVKRATVTDVYANDTTESLRQMRAR